MTNQPVLCTHCGSDRLALNVSVSNSIDVGLEYRALKVLRKREPLLADVCMDCGSVHRFHVQNADRDWQQSERSDKEQ